MPPCAKIVLVEKFERPDEEPTFGFGLELGLGIGFGLGIEIFLADADTPDPFLLPPVDFVFNTNQQVALPGIQPVAPLPDSPFDIFDPLFPLGPPFLFSDHDLGVDGDFDNEIDLEDNILSIDLMSPGPSTSEVTPVIIEVNQSESSHFAAQNSTGYNDFTANGVLSSAGSHQSQHINNDSISTGVTDSDSECISPIILPANVMFFPLPESPDLTGPNASTDYVLSFVSSEYLDESDSSSYRQPNGSPYFSPPRTPSPINSQDNDDEDSNEIFSLPPCPYDYIDDVNYSVATKETSKMSASKNQPEASTSSETPNADNFNDQSQASTSGCVHSNANAGSSSGTVNSSGTANSSHPTSNVTEPVRHYEDDDVIEIRGEDDDSDPSDGIIEVVEVNHPTHARHAAFSRYQPFSPPNGIIRVPMFIFSGDTENIATDSDYNSTDFHSSTDSNDTAGFGISVNSFEHIRDSHEFRSRSQEASSYSHSVPCLTRSKSCDVPLCSQGSVVDARSVEATVSTASEIPSSLYGLPSTISSANSTAQESQTDTPLLRLNFYTDTQANSDDANDNSNSSQISQVVVTTTDSSRPVDDPVYESEEFVESESVSQQTSPLPSGRSEEDSPKNVTII